MSDIKLTVYMEPTEDAAETWDSADVQQDIGSAIAEMVKQIGRHPAVQIDFWELEQVEHECQEQGHQYKEMEHPVGPLDGHDCRICIHCDGYRCDVDGEV